MVWAQEPERERTMIHIEHANQLSKTQGSDAVLLKGQVHIRHDSTHFYCDSAYYYEAMNSFDAFQNVHICVNDSIDMYSRTMIYDGNLRFAEFFDNVRMMDDSTLLETDYMTYDRNQHLACYPNHGVTTRGDKQLVSDKGFYRDDLKEFRIFHNVVATSPKYQMTTDTLYYNTRVEKMWIQGGGRMKNENNQEIEADSMLYDCRRHFTRAVNNIQITDTAYKVIMRGQYGEIWEKTGFSFATDSAYAMYYDDPDTLFIASDTMFYRFKTELNDVEELMGRCHVRFFKSDMQGQCDTMTYNMADSTILMRVDPVLWTDDSQMTGDHIDIRIAHHAIDSLFQRGKAFIISKDSIEGYNQINGADMISKFIDGGIDHVRVTGDAKVISWLREDDGALIGINKSSSKRMRIVMDNKSISLIKYYENIDETLYPEKDLKEKDRYLEGFIWREDERPKAWIEIFNKPTSSSLRIDQ
jgi:lipopolysaccharide export system protein LptA